MAKKQTGSKTASLFDIRLKYLDHDVVVLKGSEHDAASALLSGKIVLSLNEPLIIKKLTLRLYSTLRLHWTDHYQTSKGIYPKPNRFEKVTFEYVWDPATIAQYLDTLTDQVTSNASNTPAPLSRNHSSASLKNLGHTFRSKSSSNLAHLSSLSLSNSSTNLHRLDSSTNLKGGHHQLVPGNYEIPFSTILPGNIPETIEGLPGGSQVYKLEANIDRGKFHNNLIAKKHVRVIRTMTTDSVELSETVAVDNTWPQKVEYSINVPSKAIAIGSRTPISLMFVPLLKGLKLGKIKIQLVEFWSYLGYTGPPHNGERLVCEKNIDQPADNDEDFQLDKWEVDAFLRIPASLSECTQDCDIGNHVKVRHKLKFTVGLINPDGHVSELRASLPIQLFISPFVTISARNEDEASETGSLNEERNPVDDENNEELIFTTDPHNTSSTSLNQLNDNEDEAGRLRRSNNGSMTSFSGIQAPPLYERHIYDRLWSDISPIDSPLSSGAATPRSGGPRASDVQNFLSMSPIDTNQLSENLRQLSLQRQAQEAEYNSSPGSGDRAVFNLGGEGADYFTRGRPQAELSDPGSSGSINNVPLANDMPLATPGLQTPPIHLSRANSDQVLDASKLYKVPSYHQAMKSEPDELLSPAYEPPLPGSNISVAELNRRLDEHRLKSRPLSRGSSLNMRGSSSLTSSNGSSPSHSRNLSSNNLRNFSSTNLSGSTSPNHAPQNPALFSMPPTSSSPNNSSHKPHLHDLAAVAHLPRQLVTQPSSSASDRNAAVGAKSNSSLNLHNLQFLSRKDKK